MAIIIRLSSFDQPLLMSLLYTAIRRFFRRSLSFLNLRLLFVCGRHLFSISFPILIDYYLLFNSFLFVLLICIFCFSLVRVISLDLLLFDSLTRSKSIAFHFDFLDFLIDFLFF
jgi:hypothetical protein